MVSSIFSIFAIPALAASLTALGSPAFLSVDNLIDNEGSLGRMKSQYPYYHTTKELENEIERLAAVCDADMEVHRESEGHAVTLTTVRIRPAHGKVNATGVNRAFLLFGEHARELIGPESGLYFLRQLCGDAEMQQGQDRNEFLATHDIMMVLNANPRSRKVVESGDFCVRTNPEGVDLNRNWDEKFAGQDDSITNPGPSPFSEPETKILKRLVEDFRPTTFITVHSGTRGMYMPWAFDMEHLAQRNGPAMRGILEKVDNAYCECPFGAAGREVGYSCPGTCLDWVYDKLETPYVFAYEIYTGRFPDIGAEDEMKFRFEQQRHGDTKDDTDDDENDVSGQSLLQVSSQAQSAVDMSEQESPEHCFWAFNPDTHERYNSSVVNWAAAYVETLSLVVTDLQKSARQGHTAEHS